MSKPPPPWRATLYQLAADHPDAVPFTLALLLQARTGQVRTGTEVKRLLQMRNAADAGPRQDMD